MPSRPRHGSRPTFRPRGLMQKKNTLSAPKVLDSLLVVRIFSEQGEWILQQSPG